MSGVFYNVAEDDFPIIQCEYTVKDFDDYEQQIRQILPANKTNSIQREIFSNNSTVPHPLPSI